MQFLKVALYKTIDDLDPIEIVSYIKSIDSINEMF